MNVLHFAAIFAARAVWRLTGARPAGRVLLRALESRDESLRATAGMLLVRSRGRAIPLLSEALREQRNVPLVLTLLGDIGDPRSRPVIEPYSAYPDPDVAKAARAALAAYALRARTARA